MIADRCVTVPGWVVLSAVRYALGRKTYIVSETVDLVIQLWPELDEGTRSLIRRDVSGELAMWQRVPDFAPHDFDISEWKRLIVSDDNVIDMAGRRHEPGKEPMRCLHCDGQWFRLIARDNDPPEARHGAITLTQDGTVTGYSGVPVCLTCVLGRDQ